MASEISVLTTFDRMWLVLSEDLKSIRDDPGFDPKKKQQPKAGKLYAYITNRCLLQYAPFFYDMVIELVNWSLATQEKNSLLIEQADLKNIVIGKLESMKTTDGEKLKEPCTNAVIANFLSSYLILLSCGTKFN